MSASSNASHAAARAVARARTLGGSALTWHVCARGKGEGRERGRRAFLESALSHCTGTGAALLKQLRRRFSWRFWAQHEKARTVMAKPRKDPQDRGTLEFVGRYGSGPSVMPYMVDEYAALFYKTAAMRLHILRCGLESWPQLATTVSRSLKPP